MKVVFEYSNTILKVVFEYSNTILLEDVYRGTNGDADADMV
jgi:hypothetical protein